MFETLDRQVIPARRETTRLLDTAVGVLVGWRRCSTDAAFRELITVSDRHDIPVFSLASALVSLASRGTDGPAASTPAAEAAEREWGLTYLL